MRSSAEGANGQGWPGRHVWAPVLANLLIGVVAIVPCVCVRWLVAEYPSVDCGGGIGCDKEASESASVMTYGAALGGMFVAGLILMVDVLVPRQEGWSVRRWLAMSVLVPVPFAVGQAAGWW
ncbi:hypothetical protein ABZY57_06860 [Streptomyces sp. NPDC006450]|uniref:hypothetical protein n=1 Tax=Streptomyces sp. NPDC006450 TaxID=3155458 RepID=UPI0033AA8A75